MLSNRKDDSAKRKTEEQHDPLTTWTDPRGNLIRSWLTGLVIRRNLLFMLIGLEIMITPLRWPLWSPEATGARPTVSDVHSRHQPRGGRSKYRPCAVLQLHRRRQNLNIDSVSEMRDEHACLNHYFAIDWLRPAGVSRGRWSENVSAIVGVGSVGRRRW